MGTSRRAAKVGSLARKRSETAAYYREGMFSGETGNENYTVGSDPGEGLPKYLTYEAMFFSPFFFFFASEENNCWNVLGATH